MDREDYVARVGIDKKMNIKLPEMQQEIKQDPAGRLALRMR